MEWELENTAAALIDDYLRRYRPLLPHATSDWLFPSKTRDDRPRGKKGLGSAITREIHSLVGVRMTPHQFRAFAGALILERNPHAIEDLRIILGHSTTETAMIYYARWAPKEAVARFNAQLSAERRKTRLMADAAFARGMGRRARGGVTRGGSAQRSTP
jgi:integrase